MKCSDFTIMFAEDEPGIQKIYERSFSREGYKVVLAGQGEKVLAELKDQKIDLLVTDMGMPGMDTLELFLILKIEYPHLPVIVVTGEYLNVQKDFTEKGFNVKALFNKPVALAELKEKIQQILKIGEVN